MSDTPERGTAQSVATHVFTPTDFAALVNQTLEYAYGSTLIVGEVASFKINQGKWVFFDLKDAETSVSCFMSVWSLKYPLEDGMKIVVRGTPKLTKWGKFSVTVTAVKPVGEGSIKKAYEMLKKKLAAEGLFDPAKKRSIPKGLPVIGVISSTNAAGYADFVKILNARWGGMRVIVAHTQVQGMDAPRQMVKALDYFNERGEVMAIAMIRGGGSADDLSCYNDEELVRAVAASKIPVITGVGHEVDESLVDLAADVRASTPSNAAEMLTYDRAAVLDKVKRMEERARSSVKQEIVRAMSDNSGKVRRVGRSLVAKYIEPSLKRSHEQTIQMYNKIQSELKGLENLVAARMKVLAALNPENVLAQGYAILSGKVSPGSVVKITTLKLELEAEIKKVAERK